MPDIKKTELLRKGLLESLLMLRLIQCQAHRSSQGPVTVYLCVYQQAHKTCHRACPYNPKLWSQPEGISAEMGDDHFLRILLGMIMPGLRFFYPWIQVTQPITKLIG